MPVYVQTPTVTLPYPGIRPFRRDEFEIFFGREEHVAKLAEKLHSHHFVAVVGPSGCGKSSLVTAGLMPQLDSAHAVDAKGPWYEAIIRPGDRPFSRLAEALIHSGILPDQADEDGDSRIGFLDAELRRGPLGLIQALGGADSLNGGNLLVVVDQFEEIFRFRNETSDQEAHAFVALLLETVRQSEQKKLPIYVMLTMRSDYMGDCNQFQGLPEAISDSQFLTPRPNREQRHAAIVGPAAMFGGEVEPALVNRLLNDMGDDPDQLPIMQHALMRMWSLTTLGEHHKHGESNAESATDGDTQPVQLTTDIYDEVGGWHNTLSNHADEAFDGLGDCRERQRVAETMFRSLTQRGPNQNDVRRPVSVQEVADVAGVSTAVVKEVADTFRRLDRCFLTPGLVEGDARRSKLADDDILDISHESLIRQWARLREWARKEGDSAADYSRLEDAALRWQSKEKGFLQSPELDVLLKRFENEQWTPVWAARYGTDFDLAMEYLEESQKEKQRLDAEAEAQRDELFHERARADEQAQTVARFRRYVSIIGVVSVLCLATTVWAVRERINSDSANTLKEEAQEQLGLLAIEKKQIETAKAEAIAERKEAEKAKIDANTERVRTFLEKRKLENAKAEAEKERVRMFLEKQQLQIAKDNAEKERVRTFLEKVQVEASVKSSGSIK